MKPLRLLSAFSVLVLSLFIFGHAAKGSGCDSIPFRTLSLSAPISISVSAAKSETLIFGLSLEQIPVQDLQVSLAESSDFRIETYQLMPLAPNQPGSLMVDGLVPLGSTLVTPTESPRIIVLLHVPETAPQGPQKRSLIFRTPKGRTSLDLDLFIWGFSLPQDLPITIMATLRPDPGVFQQYGVDSPSGLTDVYRAYLQRLRDFKINSISGFIHPSRMTTSTVSLEDASSVPLRLELVNSIYKFRSFSIRCDGMGDNATHADTEAIERDVEVTYPDFLRYLASRNWSDRAYIKLWDEPKREWLPRAQHLYELVHKTFPDLKTVYTGRFPGMELLKSVHVWIVDSRGYDAHLASEARRAGVQIWLYANPWHGTDHSPAHQRLVGYTLYDYDFSGYYIWSVNFWPHNPWVSAFGRNARFGRGTFFYPDPRSGHPLPSLRLLSFFRGLQDYQILHLLKEASQQNRIDKASFENLSRDISELTRNINSISPPVDWETMDKVIHKAGSLLNTAR